MWYDFFTVLVSVCWPSPEQKCSGRSSLPKAALCVHCCRLLSGQFLTKKPRSGLEMTLACPKKKKKGGGALTVGLFCKQVDLNLGMYSLCRFIIIFIINASGQTPCQYVYHPLINADQYYKILHLCSVKPLVIVSSKFSYVHFKQGCWKQWQ